MKPEKNEKFDNAAVAVSLCICRRCPTFAECGEKIAYCFTNAGKSKCIKQEKGCICGGCPVTSKFGLDYGYYCTRGSNKRQGGK